jgi:small subunit ribosomal protein S8
MYWDTIIRVKNGLERGYENVKVPYSRFDLDVLESLVEEGFLESATRKGRGVKRIIDVKLKYDEKGSPAVRGIKFVSRPSRRMYSGYKDIKASRQGYGRYIVSTPRGILTDKEARHKKVGGQVLFEIW